MSIKDWERQKIERTVWNMPGWARSQVEKAALKEHMSLLEYVFTHDVCLDPNDWDKRDSNDPPVGVSRSELIKYGYEEEQ